jgi:hypothetical protein
VTAIVLIPGELVTAGAGPAALPAGPSTPDRMRERPLVGSGTEDPSRRSLAALQWQGTEELRQVTVAGRPVTINGTATPIPPQRTPAPSPWAPEPEAEEQASPLGIGGPTPSSVADGLSAEGLVQRRRRRPVDLGTSLPPQSERARRAERALQADQAMQAGQAMRAGLTPHADLVIPHDQVPRAGFAAPPELPTRPTSATPVFPDTRPAPMPTSAAPMFAAPTSPAGHVGVGESTGDVLSTEDGLPRRVRQANLVPQLRRPAGGPVPDDEETVPMRSPEQMRSIMSALQQGTTRGRIDAARHPATPVGNGGENGGNYGKRAATLGISADSGSEDRSNRENPDDHGRVSGTSFADAATVSFPAIVNVTLARGETAPETPPGGPDAAGDPERNDVTRPEKDA